MSDSKTLKSVYFTYEGNKIRFEAFYCCCVNVSDSLCSLCSVVFWHWQTRCESTQLRLPDLVLGCGTGPKWAEKEHSCQLWARVGTKIRLVNLGRLFQIIHRDCGVMCQIWTAVWLNHVSCLLSLLSHRISKTVTEHFYRLIVFSLCYL